MCDSGQFNPSVIVQQRSQMQRRFCAAHLYGALQLTSPPTLCFESRTKQGAVAACEAFAGCSCGSVHAYTVHSCCPPPLELNASQYIRDIPRSVLDSKNGVKGLSSLLRGQDGSVSQPSGRRCCADTALPVAISAKPSPTRKARMKSAMA